MKSDFPQPAESDPTGLAAAEWALRHDRGLTAAEQDEFSQWLAADAGHRAAWAEHRWGWEELDRLAGLQTSVHALPDPDLLMPRAHLGAKAGRAAGRWRVLPRLIVPLAAAAALALGFALWRQTGAKPPMAANPEAPRSLPLIQQRTLADGSIVELNRGAVVTERFTPGERRVQLERGEAHFRVARNERWPFVVEAGGVAVRAVGTAFNVQLDAGTVEVLVTEGRVAVAPMAGPAPVVRPPTVDPEMHLGDKVALIARGERAVVSLAPAAPAFDVTALSPVEIEARLAWKPRLLDFTNTPLPEIVAEFNRHNPVRLILGDASLGALRLSATFRSDNVEGFVRLMTSNFGMHAEWRGDGELVLLQAR